MEEDRQSDKERQEVIIYIYTHTHKELITKQDTCGNSEGKGKQKTKK